METCLELQRVSERRVCWNRPQTSRDYPENTAQVSKDGAIQLSPVGCPPARDEGVAQEFERELAERLGQHNDSDDPKKLWTDVKTQMLKMLDEND